MPKIRRRLSPVVSHRMVNERFGVAGSVQTVSDDTPRYNVEDSTNVVGEVAVAVGGAGIILMDNPQWVRRTGWLTNRATGQSIFPAHINTEPPAISSSIELPTTSEAEDPDFWNKNITEIFDALSGVSPLQAQISQFPHDTQLQAMVSLLRPKELKQILAGVLADACSACRRQDLLEVAEELNSWIATAEETVEFRRKRRHIDNEMFRMEKDGP